MASSLIVGYKTDTANGSYAYAQVCPVFDSVGSANVIKFSDLKLEGVDRGDTIQVFGEDGEVRHLLTYKRRGTKPNYEYYWELTDYSLDPDDPTISEVDTTTYTFPRGAGFWYCPKADTTVTQSGQVNTNSVSYVTDGGYAYTQAGNPFPVAVKLSAFQFGAIDRGDTVQVFGEDGEVRHLLTYKRRGSKPNYEYYWELTDYSVDPDDPTVSEVNPNTYTFAAGYGFWICLKNAQTITLKGITL